jgi:hypothetical protein
MVQVRYNFKLLPFFGMICASGIILLFSCIQPDPMNLDRLINFVLIIGAIVLIANIVLFVANPSGSHRFPLSLLLTNGFLLLVKFRRAKKTREAASI